jgi:hypothetical protein
MPVAIGAGIAAIDVIIVAVLGLIITFGLFLIARAIFSGLAFILRNIGGPLGDAADWLESRVDDAVNYAEDKVSSWVSSATHPIVEAMDTIANNLRGMAYSARYVYAVIAQALLAITHTNVGDAINGVQSWTQQGFQSITQWVQQAIDQSQRDTVQWVEEAYGNLSQWADGEITNLYTGAQQLQQSLVQDFDVVSQAITTAEETATAYTQQAYTQAVNYAQDAINAATDELKGEISADYQQLASTLVADMQWTSDTIGNLDNALTGAIGLVSDVVTTNVIPRVIAIEGDITDCLKPMCGHGPDFMKGLEGILGLLQDAEWLAWLAAAVHDPKGTAQQAAGDTEAVISVPRDILQTALGIKLG